MIILYVMEATQQQQVLTTVNAIPEQVFLQDHNNIIAGCEINVTYRTKLTGTRSVRFSLLVSSQTR